MRYLKIFEEFEEDDLGLIDIYGSECDISISIGTKYECKDQDLIPKMIEDYKEMYIRNGEWSGGPCNSEWLEKYHKEFNVSLSTAKHAWKPVVILNVKTDNFGVIKIGFSIYSKKTASFDWSKMDIKDEYYQKSLDRLNKYIRKEIFDKSMKFDDVINFLDLKCDFYYTSIEEDKKD
jgi:hypothetical protein